MPVIAKERAESDLSGDTQCLGGAIRVGAYAISRVLVCIGLASSGALSTPLPHTIAYLGTSSGGPEEAKVALR